MSTKQCLTELAAALGKEFTPEQRKAFEEDVDAIIENVSRQENISDLSAEIAKATKEYTSDIILSKAVEKRQAILNEIKRETTLELVDTVWKDNPAKGLYAFLGNVLNKRKGAGNGVAVSISTKSANYINDIQSKLTRMGLMDVAVSKAVDKDIFIAMSELNQKTPNLEKLSGLDQQAVEIAKVLKETQDLARLEANKAGAWIREKAGYALRRSHDQFKIAYAAGGDFVKGAPEHFKAWRDFINERLDWEKMAKDILPANRDKFLLEIYTQFANGKHTTFGPDSTGIAAGAANLGKKLSKSRVFEFKTPEAEFEYHSKFGNDDGVVGGVVQGLRRLARDTAIMERMGPNAENNLESVIKEIEQRFVKAGDTLGQEKFLKGLPKVRNLFKELTGENKRPENADRAKLHGSARKVLQGGSLGSAILTSLNDPIQYASQFRFADGQSFAGMISGLGDAMMAHIQGWNRGADTKAALAKEGSILIEAVSQVDRIFGEEEQASKRLSSINSFLFKVTGLTGWQERMRLGAAKTAMSRYADNAMKAFDSLSEGVKGQLERFDITADRWDVVRNLKKVNVDDVDLIGSSSFDELTPEAAKLIDSTEFVKRRKAEILAKEKLLQEKFTQQTARDGEWLLKKKEKTEQLKSKLKESTEKYKELKESSSQKQIQRYELRLKELSLKIEKAEVEADMFAYLRTESERNKLGKLIDKTEEGELFSDIARGKLNNSLDRYSQRRGNIGEGLGSRRQKLEARIKQVKDEIASLSDDAESKISAKNTKFFEKLDSMDRDLLSAEEKTLSRISERGALLLEYNKKIDSLVSVAREQELKAIKESYGNMIHEYARFSVTEPGDIERALTLGGTKAGSGTGEARRYAMMFKSFTVSYMRNHMGRELFGYSPKDMSTAEALKAMVTGRNNKGAAGLANMIAFGVLTGSLTMTLKDLKNGKKPRGIENPSDAFKYFMAAAAQSGGIGIWTDFVFSEENRFGGGVASTLGGPALRTVEDAFGIIQSLKSDVLDDGDPSDTGKKVFEFVRNNTPGLNVVANSMYTKAMFDYLIAYRMHELLSPGSLYRMESRLRDKKGGQEFILPPSSVIPYGGK